jgi:NAD(P)-dependent dehydrogenase (short-subunit alcohol dehydrogenase family)
MRISHFKAHVWLFADMFMAVKVFKVGIHGLIHWVSQYYGTQGITCNGVAPALIKHTDMLPGNPEELATRPLLEFGQLGLRCRIRLIYYGRDPDRCAGRAGGDCGDGSLDGQDWLCHEQSHSRRCWAISTIMDI